MKPIKTNGIAVFIQGTSLLKIFIGFLLFLFMIFSLSGVLTVLKPEYRISSSSVNTAANKITGEMLYHFLGWENHHFMQSLDERIGSTTFMNMLFKLSTNINLDDPRSLLGRELPYFSIYDKEILVAGEGTNYTNMPFESAPPIDLLRAEQQATLQNIEDLEKPSGEKAAEPPINTTGDRKVVYLYFSHNTESFLPYLKGVTNPNLAHHSELNVTKIGDKLKEELESKGIGTTVEKANIQANLNEKGWDYWRSYQESRTVVQAATKSDRNLTYFIDIHRDSHRKEDTTKEINGKPYAKLAFVIGTEHPNYEKNARLANELHKRLEEKYKGLSRGLLPQQGSGNNGIYNQDLSENAILIEFGGVDNTFEELNRSAEALADVFSEFYWQAESVSNPVQEQSEKK
ncbi:stage II sporulation protein P [Bacillus sp. DTU_2020_1000418_1_SI_GHA_SEK_038]|uniref:stage II sporulation protein P n=1 Tax=Bacillus sp. DTU_2020_1000418_1_SI_GHA_SEK_038 TaxID=3077585 RepID=UPI0028F0B459|nr:stage II sporulation protein P [Bacillus sp. DTU_2020_1000418_1_SI_GHA_SEK_038]WNS74359.1 stage II sporulation protein P [Bacillus sp. DTU_2020_1000418_1_SI_GHA_SEK_038]